MSHRLQVLLADDEAMALTRAARREGLSLSEWARRLLRRASRQEGRPSSAARLAAIDRALQCGHPTADIEDMLADIESGRSLR